MEFDRITTEEGLSDNEVIRTQIDSSGLLWILTVSGLDNYNGKELVNFSKTFLPMIHEEILDAKVFGADNLYLLTNTAVYHLSNYKLYKYDLIEKLAQFPKSELHYDKNLNLFWIYNTRYCFNLTNNKFEKNPLDWQKDFSIYFRGNVSYGARFSSTDSLLKIYKIYFKNKIDSVSIKLKENIGWNSFIVDKNEIAWFFTQDGKAIRYQIGSDTICTFGDRTTEQSRTSFTSTMFYSLPIDSSNQILVGTYPGILLIVQDNNLEYPDVIKCYPDEDKFNKLPLNPIKHILDDAYGNLYLSYIGSGVRIYRPSKNKFTKIIKVSNDTLTLKSNIITSVEYDFKNNLFAGTKRGLSYIQRNKHDSVKNYMYDTKFYNNHISFIKSIDSTYLLILNWGNQPMFFDQVNFKFKSLNPLNISTKLWEDNKYTIFTSSATDVNNNKMYLTDWSGSGLFNEYDFVTQQYTQFHYNNCVTNCFSNLGTSIVKIDSFLYLGTDRDIGLQKVNFNRKGDIVSKPLDPKYRESDVKTGDVVLIPSSTSDSTLIRTGVTNKLYKDADKSLWVCTPNGLYYKKHRSERFNRVKIFDILNITCFNTIIQDNRNSNHYWTGTTKGLYKFDVFNDQILNGYTIADGLTSNTININGLAMSTNGELAIGTNSGLNIFHPDSVFDRDIESETSTPFVNLDGINYPFYEEMTIPNSTRNIEFIVHSSDLSNPKLNKYSYFLSGLDQEWSYPTNNNHILVNNLSYGNYKLYINSTNHLGIWSKNIRCIEFSIPAPWYFTKTFILILFCCLGFGIYYLFKRAEKKKQKYFLEQQRQIKYLQIQTLQSQINPHFIFNVLGSMQNQILNNDPIVANQHLIKLSKLIRRFLDSTIDANNVMHKFKLNEITLDHEIELLQMYIEFEQLQKPRKFSYSLKVDTLLATNNIRVPTMILQPHVENAIKHGLLYKDGLGTLQLHFTQSNPNELTCVIIDDGVGRIRSAEIQKSSLKLYKSHGTSLVADRVKILNELGYLIDIKIDDNIHGGTIITVHFNL